MAVRTATKARFTTLKSVLSRNSKKSRGLRPSERTSSKLSTDNDTKNSNSRRRSIPRIWLNCKEMRSTNKNYFQTEFQARNTNKTRTSTTIIETYSTRRCEKTNSSSTDLSTTRWARTTKRLFEGSSERSIRNKGRISRWRIRYKSKSSWSITVGGRIIRLTPSRLPTASSTRSSDRKSRPMTSESIRCSWIGRPRNRS